MDSNIQSTLSRKSPMPARLVAPYNLKGNDARKREGVDTADGEINIQKVFRLKYFCATVALPGQPNFLATSCKGA